MSYQRVVLLGNLGKDPELKEFGETKVCNFSLATSERVKEENVTEWHNCTAFGNVAENLAKYKKKGETVLVEGRIKTEKYEKDGENRYTTKIIAQSVKFIGGKKSEAASEETDFGF